MDVDGRENEEMCLQWVSPLCSHWPLALLLCYVFLIHSDSQSARCVPLLCLTLAEPTSYGSRFDRKEKETKKENEKCTHMP